MTAILDRVPVDRINAEAKKVHAGRLLLTILGGILYGIGWIAAKTVKFIWLCLAWAVVAVKVGWQDAGRVRRTDGAA